MDKRQKAYMVSIKGCETDEGGAEIVFSSTPAEAKAHTSLDYTLWTDLRAVRQPQFDQYAARGSVPTKALLKDGWWRKEPCCKCGRWVTVNQSYIDDGELLVEFDERGEIQTVTCFDCIEKEKAEKWSVSSVDKRTVDDIIHDHKEINALATALHGESDGYVRVSGVTPMERLMVVAVLKELTERYILVNPAALAKVEEDARVGRAVEEWIESVEFQIRGSSRPGGYADIETILTSLREAIAKAREGNGHA